MDGRNGVHAIEAYQMALKISPDFVEAQQAAAALQQQKK
jgi:hypothetical protein